jgi:hypothetical protein
VGRLARASIAVGLTLVVLWRANPGEVLAVARRASPSWILAAILLVVFDRALMAYRWLVLLRAVDAAQRPRFRDVMRVFFVSTFIGTFLPSVGGDVVRAYGLSRYGVAGAQSAASVLMDRVLGVASILVVGVIGLAFAGRRFVDAGVLAALGAGVVLCAAMALVVFRRGASQRLISAAGLVRSGRVQKLLTGLVEATHRYSGHRGDLLNVLAGSIGVQILRVVQAYCLGMALGIAAGPLLYFAFVPVILLIMLLPITVNGLGTSQLAFVWFFGQAGVPQSAAFALSILFVALGVVGNLPGGILYAMNAGGLPPPRGTSAPSERTP